MAAVVGKLTDCSICMDELSEPRFLPCHHTFCLRCIEELRSSHQQARPRAGGVPCPLCRSTFSSPADRSVAHGIRSIAEDKKQLVYQPASLSVC